MAKVTSVYIWRLSVLLTACVPAIAQAETITFDDLALSPNSYFNGPVVGGQVSPGPYGGDLTTGNFTSGGVSFQNGFENVFNTWNGFAYSNVTDNTTAGYLNQHSAFTGTGHGAGDDNYGVAFGYDSNPPNFTLPAGKSILGAYITNTTYAALTMRDGDGFGFAKQFGGPTGNDEDWFKLTITGKDANGNLLANIVEFYLADFRGTSAQDYIVNDWRFVDLSALAGASTLLFGLTSSDSGPFGMNTPGYFAIDDIVLGDAAAAPLHAPEPASLVLWSMLTVVGAATAYRRRKKST